MKFELKFGKGTIGIDLPGAFNEVQAPAPVPLVSLENAVGPGVLNPTGSPPLNVMARGAASVAISIPDLTRPFPAESVLSAVVANLESAGVGRDRITVIVATGVHRPLTSAEMSAMLGPLAGLIAIENHAPSGGIEMLGTTSRGTPVGINSKLCRASLAISLGSVAFHFHAGFGGGRKGFVPGLALGETARVNHLLALSGPGDSWHQGCGPGKLAGNPVHEDLVEAARMLPAPAFVVNVAQDKEGRAFACACGDMVESHESLCARYSAFYRRSLDRPADAVVVSAGGNPKDVNLIQSHKAAAHAASAVRDGGTMLLVAECAEGAGHADLEYWFDKPLRRMKSLSGETGKKYVQTAYSFREKAARFDFLLLSSLDPEFVRSAGLIPVSSAEEACRFIRDKHGADFGGILLRDSSMLLTAGD